MSNIRLVALSDTHGYHDQIVVPDGDILICAGDWCRDGRVDDAHEFLKWFASKKHKHKVLVAGNHDRVMETHPHLVSIPKSVTYLEDSGATIMGLKFWGSPCTPFFLNWAFNRTRGAQIAEHWDKIPKKVDVLVTHGPPHSILDISKNHGDNLGCKDLWDKVNKVKPKVHIFGHIHYSHGKMDLNGIKFRNVSICEESYVPLNPVTIIDL